MRNNNNNKIGRNIEKKGIEYLSNLNFWVHYITPSINGQPCDLIAYKDNTMYLIDIKDSESDYFVSSRIEPNQEMCFEFASLFNINKTLFLIYFKKIDKWYVLEYKTHKEKEKKSYKVEDLIYADTYFK